MTTQKLDIPVIYSDNVFDIHGMQRNGNEIESFTRISFDFISLPPCAIDNSSLQ